MKIKTDTIYKAIYELVKRANIILPENIYSKLEHANICENEKKLILKNAKIAFDNMRPLCQDTGQVTVFIQMGQNIQLEGDFIEDIINKAVENSYRDNFFRKSTCVDAFFDRNNNNKNTPAIIHTEFIKEQEFRVLVGIKGGGAENMSQMKMFLPTSSKKEIFDFVKEVAQIAAKNSCPPLSVGIGIGGTVEKCAYLAKKALYFGHQIDTDMENVFEVKMLTSPTHIASMPVCVNINCHSARYAEAKIIEDKIIYKKTNYILKDPEITKDGIEINTDEFDKIKNLKTGTQVYLSGTIYTARDMAHEKLIDLIKNNKKLPFDLKNSIIFYAGPCPKNNEEIIGPIGPTTSKRMDKFAPILYKNGVLATIGKGNRTFNDSNYFKMFGGIASYIQNCIISSKIIAFEELGAEAIYKLTVKDLPIVKN